MILAQFDSCLPKQVQTIHWKTLVDRSNVLSRKKAAMVSMYVLLKCRC